MTHSPIEAPSPTLDARWIVALWVALHGGKAGADSAGELVLKADTIRAVAGSAILALATQLDPETARTVMAALAKQPSAPHTHSEADVEDSLKRLGIRLYEADAQTGLSVAGFGKFCWNTPAT